MCRTRRTSNGWLREFERHGRVDLLINNAGILSLLNRFHKHLDEKREPNERKNASASAGLGARSRFG